MPKEPAMGERWIKEAVDLAPVGTAGTMSGVGGPRATLHCTVSQPGSFDAMVRVLRDKKSEPHLVYDPKTDRLGQFFPLDKSGRALARGSALPYSHNKVGTVNIQIEVCAMPVDWTADWKPGPNFRAMIRAVRSWGIKDQFVARPARTATDRSSVVRPVSLLTSTSGGGLWWGHCHYPDGETHWDPGPISLPRFFAAAPLPAPPAAPAPKPVPAPAPAPIPTSKDVSMHMLVRAQGTDPVWLTDLITRRWVTDPAELAAVRAALKSRGVSDAIVTVPSLHGYGIPLGPTPTEVTK
jgi:hypothetical protein